MGRSRCRICEVAIWFLCSSFTIFAGVEAIGVNYGLLGDNLPSPDKVISLYKSRGIQSLRLFNPDQNALHALKGSDISVILGTLNEDLQQLASSQSYAATWVQTNVAPFSGSVHFKCIDAGNEVIPGDLATYVLPAMQNLDAALNDAGYSIPVTTAVSTQVLGDSYPPSQGTFSDSASSYMAPIATFLESKGYPLLVNVYPYFSYTSDTKEVHLDYALFNAHQTVVLDGGVQYSNLFDAIVDSVYAALEKSGGPSVDVVVSETGWPSGGGAPGATVENAMIYNNNVVAHVKRGTPRRPGKELETYLFAMFNENQKPEGVEQHFGLYRPDMTEVYHVDFS
ncbi:hypothetical protein LUZ62_085321 [Rhynchospora pubera]|uniref:Uncharacterized protein n=1 Tax=Rhynchospora pubera TaxID=906938 RepID=A0AAV8C612_9POAL|nr:hypothetical protein LUZ62_085321 [Rhynchospora pubera]